MKKILLSIFAISLCFMAKAQLTGMNPNTAIPGQTLQTNVTGPGLFIQSSSPSGNLFSVILTNGPTTISIFDYGNWVFNNITVNSTDDFTTDFFNVPITATPGAYLLTVVTGDIWDPWMNQQTYTLPAAFTVSPPDGYINGVIYNDINQNGMQDGGELGIANETIQVTNPNYTVTTDAAGAYSMPAMNGVHTVQWVPYYTHNYQLSSDSASYSVLVSSNTQGGFDFGLKPALLSMSINYSQIGQTISTTITSDGLFTSVPTNIRIAKGGYYIYATNISVVNTNQLNCTFTIPFSTGYIGSYALYVDIGPGYTLYSAFTVTAFNAGITGQVYYDTNGNGVYDAGETLLANSKVELTPGNILGFTNNSGTYGFGTANGSYVVQYLLQLSDSQLGLLASAFLVVYTLTAPLFGILGDRSSRPRWLAFGILLWSAATALSGLARNYLTLFLSRALVGIGEAAYVTISPSLLADYFPKRLRGRIFAVFFCAIPVGSALGYVFGGLMDKHYGWRSAFLIGGIPGAILAAFAFFLRDPPRGSGDGETAAHEHATSGAFKTYRSFFSNRPYMLTVLGYAAYTFAVGGLGFWMPAFLERIRGIPRAAATVDFGAIVVVTGFIGTFLGGWLGDRWALRKKHAYLWLSSWTMIGAAPFALLALAAPSPSVFYPAIVVAELLTFMSTGPINSMIVNFVAPNLRASAMALCVFIIHAIGDVVSPPLIGVVSDLTSLAIAVLLVPLSMAVCAAIWWKAARAAERVA